MQLERPGPGALLLRAHARRPEDRAGHRGREPRVLADQDVVEDGHVLEEPDGLERPGDAAPHDRVGAKADDAPALEEDLALVRRQEPRDHVEEGRLPGAVRADQAHDRARRDDEVDLVDRDRGRRRPWSRRGPRAAGRPPASRRRRRGPEPRGDALGARDRRGRPPGAPASSVSSTSTATGCTRRPTSPSGLKSMTSASPSPKKNQRHSVRSTVVSDGDAGLGADPPDEVRHLRRAGGGRTA